MERHESVNLGNVILSLSDALDLASPKLVQHQQRTAYMAFEIGKAANLSQDRLEGLYISSLLHDVGALSLEEKISLHEFENISINTHCLYGAILFETVSWLKPFADIVKFHHKPWNEWNESIENAIVFDSQIVSLSDYVERLVRRDEFILYQRENIISAITAQSNKMFHPHIVDLFMQISVTEEFWLDVVSQRLYSVLLKNGPYKKINVDFDHIFPISKLFSNIIDFRSRFTATHSSGVAAAASEMAKLFGFSKEEVGFMEIAGNLHDLGKLSIPNSILEKPGKLTDKEFTLMKTHTYYTFNLLNTIGGLQQIAEWAAYHHEKLDGTGYPFHCKEDEINLGARIMAVADIFTALAEDRPYRQGMPKEKIIEILKNLCNNKNIDKKVYAVLSDNFENIFSYVKDHQIIARDFYEKQFSKLGG